MKLSVLALDFDGTIAEHDTPVPGIREAIAAARSRGITVLLVTGRILDELRRVAGDLHFVDGIVAENGAVVHFPNSGHTSLLAQPVSQSYLRALQARGIPHTAGQCLIDGDASDAIRQLEAIRDLELPLVLAFNRSRVMTLPQGISKATGLHVALDMLRLSPRNTLAIGDAENDFTMLQLAEVGAAVEWGSASLQQVADIVVQGSGPPALLTFLRDVAASGRLPAPRRARRRLKLGYTDDGQEFSLAVRGRNVLIAGDPNSGKSWLAGLLAEQLILHGYAVCVIDPEGDYRALEDLPGVTLLGGEEPPPTPRALLKALRYPDRSVVIDLSQTPHDVKVDYIRSVLPALNVMRRRTGLPHRIVVDEAHYFLHDGDATRMLDLEANGYTFVTYRTSTLPRELLEATEVILISCESDPAEIETLRARCAGCPGGEEGAAMWSTLPRLKMGQAAALPITEEAGGMLTTFNVGQRLTLHVRHRQKYIDVPVTEGRGFAFSGDGAGPRRVRTLRQFVEAVEQSSPEALAPYARRHDFSRWIAEVYGDHALAEALRRREEHVAPERPEDLAAEIAGAIRARYDLTTDDEMLLGSETVKHYG